MHIEPIPIYPFLFVVFVVLRAFTFSDATVIFVGIQVNIDLS